MGYSVVSVVAVLLAQAGFSVSYGLWNFDVAGAVFFSLLVSVIPAFILSYRFVWPSSVVQSNLSKVALKFFLVAIAGSLVSLVVVWASIRLGSLVTQKRAVLTGIGNVASLGATVVIWFMRYFVLDKYVFRRNV